MERAVSSSAIATVVLPVANSVSSGISSLIASPAGASERATAPSPIVVPSQEAVVPTPASAPVPP